MSECRGVSRQRGDGLSATLGVREGKVVPPAVDPFQDDVRHPPGDTLEQRDIRDRLPGPHDDPDRHVEAFQPLHSSPGAPKIRCRSVPEHDGHECWTPSRASAAGRSGRVTIAIHSATLR